MKISNPIATRKVLSRLTLEELGRLSNEQLNSVPISDRSVFGDRIWIIGNPSPGSSANTGRILWSSEIFGGISLLDPRYSNYLLWARVLVYTLIFVPAKGIRLAHSTICRSFYEIKPLIAWMIGRGLIWPAEILPNDMESYIEFLRRYAVRNRETLDEDENEDIEIAETVYYIALQGPIRLWDQRQQLARFGCASLTHHPYNGESVISIATRLASKDRGWIPPLPDEVSIPLFNQAAFFMGKPADDVIDLMNVFQSSSIPFGVEGQAKKQRHDEENQFLRDFKFSCIDGENEPWHRPLALSEDGSKAELRILVEAVRDAAALIIQGITGIRVSELCGIQAGRDPATGLPFGVRIEESDSGLYEWFILKSLISKGTGGHPRVVDWVLGMRILGDSEVPLVVRALEVLNNLLWRWHATGDDARLLVAGNYGMYLSRPGPEKNATTDGVRLGMKRFIERWVDLSNLPDQSRRKVSDNDLIRWRESKGTIFSTQMLRKTWANFTLSCDPRLLPVIQMQFQHMNLAVTEGSYIGNNPIAMEALDSMSRQRTARSVFEFVNGRGEIGGRMGRILAARLEELSNDIERLPTSEKWLRTAEWVENNQLKMFFSPHGNCLPNKKSLMRCHDGPEPVPIWLKSAPNIDVREPSLCAGCANAVIDQSHKGFWVDRYISNSLFQHNHRRETGEVHKVTQQRADQARAILISIGVDVLELQVQLAELSARGNGDD